MLKKSQKSANPHLLTLPGFLRQRLLILFLEVVFELIEERIWFIHFLVLLSTVSVHSVCFSEKLRESFNMKR